MVSLLYQVRIDMFGLVGLVWYIWLGRFSLVWQDWYGKFGKTVIQKVFFIKNNLVKKCWAKKIDKTIWGKKKSW